MKFRPEPVWQLNAELGEGPVWLPEEAALRFVDIKQGCLHRFDPVTGGRETTVVGGRPSFIVPASDGGLLVGSGNCVYRLEDGRLGPIVAAITQPEHNRTNDATVDRHGRLWFGTMDDREIEATGCIWCLAEGELHQAGGEAVVTNGPATSGDGRFLYHVDSGQQAIWRFVLGDGHALEGGEIIVRFGEGEGFPDGVVVDSEDCLWVALWDGWGLRRYTSDGALLLDIPFPCARVTKVAFGGADLRTAFVTTARTGLSAGALAEQPLAGSLFAFDAPVAGRLLEPVRLSSDIS
ncbi:SMP-30/gluconolactonase/LRE family protein [Novosphingobium sp. G106]|uniref:SMP-30/gluconolactonase/LRE family protein n=1 Tax=Novosphingobium sp. G106 TaxID=2849500 RepID=UPI001C2D74F1|nr:SMP-30/gluconolactonase/LRE family protein [Novosphingobium sp. G106]MBV1687932.1 SMP-30/gluconolactonase/LRE family protein [Novosphingobium sp. G106]